MNSRIKENVSKVFEFWCEVSPPSLAEGKTAGDIVKCFPGSFKDSKILSDVIDFAYPCVIAAKTVEVYSFVLTDTESKWRFGFCRHEPNYPNAMVIVTCLPWHDIFIKFINKLAEIKNHSDDEFGLFLSEVYNRGVPEPGSALKVSYGRGTGVFSFNRPTHFQLPNVLTSHNLSIYYSVAEPKLMIAIFAAMLAERRIIFKSNSLNRLSACIQAAHGFLYPMVWQHIFIPILPMKMKDYLSAPMPYLIGVHENLLNCIDPREIGDAVIFDCDKKELISQDDDVKSMPHELVSQLKKQLGNTEEHRDEKFSKIFLGILVQLIGRYRDGLKYTHGERITWDREAFLDSQPQNLRQFLKKILDLQIFHQFIEERLDMLNTGDGFSDEFELETIRYAEKIGKRKPYKEFLRNVKDKTNPAMKNAVKTVKEGGKGVKSVYKDLKTKLRDSPSTGGGSNMSSFQHYGNNQLPNDRHSAPNSPVFVKRTQSDALYRYPNNTNHLQMTNSYNNNINNNSSNHHNNNLNLYKSPPLSPPDSNSSSEMNLLQELQQHALFKSPAVDRSLKPHLNNTNRNTRSYITSPPTPQTSLLAPTSLPSLPLMCVVPTSQQTEHNLNPFREHTNSNHNQNNKNSNNNINNEHFHLKAKNFESSNLLSTRTTKQGTTTTITATTSTRQDVMRPTVIDSLFNTPPSEKSFRDNNQHNNNRRPSDVNNSLITDRYNLVKNELDSLKKSHNSSMVDHHNATISGLLMVQPPIPPPRNHNNSSSHHKNKIDLLSSPPQSSLSLISSSMSINRPALYDNSFENFSSNELSSNQSPNDSEDLIKLDSSSTSFELEDFDPLNKNARPLPIPSSTLKPQSIGNLSLQAGKTTTATNSSLSIDQDPGDKHGYTPLYGGFSNPIYPYVQPQQLHCNKFNSQDDIDLLRKYGLDKFSFDSIGHSFGELQLNSTTTSVDHRHQQTSQSSATTNGVVAKNDKSDWIQFNE